MKKKAIEEIQLLDRQIAATVRVDELGPIYSRLSKIGADYTAEIDVQLLVGDVKQRALARKEALQAKPAPPNELPVDPVPNDFAKTVLLPRGQFPRIDTDSFAQTVIDSKSVIPPPPDQDLSKTVLFRSPLVPQPTTVGPDTAEDRAAPRRERVTAAPIPNVPPEVVPPPPTPAVRHRKPSALKPVLIGVAAGGALALALFAWRRDPVVPTQAEVRVTSIPSGASVLLNGTAKCSSNCNFNVPVGDHLITVSLDGFESVGRNISATAASPVQLNVTLTPQPVKVRILSDITEAAVSVDNGPPLELGQGGQTFTGLAPGHHSAHITGRDGEATFKFEVTQARLPEVMGEVAARNVEAVLVASFASRARVVTSSGPWHLAVNGARTDIDAGPTGLALDKFEEGQQELVIEQGADRRTMKQTFDRSPMLTAFITADPKGVLIVSTGQSGVRVVINGVSYPQRTPESGQLRIPALGAVSVRVNKDGFDSPAPQSTIVGKGATASMEFSLVANRATSQPSAR